MYQSQKIRDVAPEVDALRFGMGWTDEDVDRAHVLVETTYGDSHPGSVGLEGLYSYVGQGVTVNGGKYSKFYVTDICDGIAQGHDGMSYSLISREMIANMVEVHGHAVPCDGMVCISSCDKAVPAHLIAMARLGLPAVFVPGGVMREGPDGLTLEQVGMYSSQYKKGELSGEAFRQIKKSACPTCGACQFMGTACTMQVMSEALGLALPGSAVIPYGMNQLFEKSYQAGRQVMELIEKGITTKDILTEGAFHNALVVHSAISGSTNALLHLPVIAREAGLSLSAEDFDRTQRDVPYLVNVKPAGKYAVEYFSYAGGVPALMLELKDKLDLSVMTVTGRTLGENLREYEESGAISLWNGNLSRYGIGAREIIHPVEKPIQDHGAIAVLKGNLAPDGCVVKYTALSDKMRHHKGKARVFEDEVAARDAIIHRTVDFGDMIIIRYVGPKGLGMPEMFYATEALASDPQLSETTALLTDGRFSGASRGPAIGHISPEAAEGGPIAFVEDGDILEIDIDARLIGIVGIAGQELPGDEISRILEQRAKAFVRPEIHDKGVLGLYKKTAVSAMQGGFIKVD